MAKFLDSIAKWFDEASSEGIPPIHGRIRVQQGEYDNEIKGKPRAKREPEPQYGFFNPWTAWMPAQLIEGRPRHKGNADKRPGA